ncbi:MAG: PHB depolymerase family esterase [Planctomycetota bacterium]|nr:PHB depolymerase family esterase [Planctomycetota bacterium]
MKKIIALVFLLSALLPGLPLVAQDTEPEEEEKNFQDYFQEGMERIKAKEYEKAISSFEKAVALNALEPSAFYNIACCYSLLDKKKEAVEWLQTSVDKGWDDFDHMQQDADLANIRAEQGYQKILTDLRMASGLNAGFYALHIPEKCLPDKEWPLLVALHSYGGNAADYLNVWKPVADEAGFILVCPQGANKVKKDSYKWNAQLAEKAVLDSVADVAKRAKIDAKKVYLNGFSQGGALVYMLGLKRPELFTGLLPIAAFYDAERHKSLLAAAAGKKQSVYIIQGLQDAETLPGARQAEKDLTAAGMRVKLAEYDIGHTMPEDRNNELLKAIQWLISGN